MLPIRQTLLGLALAACAIAMSPTALATNDVNTATTNTPTPSETPTPSTTTTYSTSTYSTSTSTYSTDAANVPVPVANTTSDVANTNTNYTPTNDNSTTARPKIGIQSADFDECEIEFTYWDSDLAARYDINFVHTNGVDHTTELFVEPYENRKPFMNTNNEQMSGQLKLVQIWPGSRMVCISAIKLSCGAATSGYGYPRSVTITADAMQQSWINKTGGRKPVDWNQGPCMYFRSASWDAGAFRALDIYRSAFECGEDYWCVARNIETFGN